MVISEKDTLDKAYINLVGDSAIKFTRKIHMDALKAAMDHYFVSPIQEV